MRTWEARIGVRLVLDGRAWRGGERRSGVALVGYADCCRGLRGDTRADVELNVL